MASQTFRGRLYSIIPELHDLDVNCPILGSEPNIYEIKNEYTSQLSNCSSINELLSKNPNIILSYISALEKNIVLKSYPTSNIDSYIIQKISILESTYSNLMQSSTQSSQ